MRHRSDLPQLSARTFLTDGGLETTLIFLEQLDLPEFAAIDLMRTSAGRAQLENYYRDYLNLARRHELGFILESPTWRASADWAPKLGFDLATMDQYNAAAIEMMHRLRAEYSADGFDIVVSGCIGPRGDGYDPALIMDADSAADYHSRQISVFAEAGVDCVSAITMGYPNEAIGVVQAAARAGVPSVISFTVETDGRLITGGGEWVERIKGIRANASRCSHAELDEAEALDDGNPEELGQDYRRLTDLLPNINIVGGCCGTDIRHLEQIIVHQQNGFRAIA